MQGFPKYLNTKQDYENVRVTFPPEQWKPAWQALLDDRVKWLNRGPLAEGDPGMEDETHRVIENEGMGDEPAERYQMELAEDPACKLLRIGFTVAEIQEVLAE